MLTTNEYWVVMYRQMGGGGLDFSPGQQFSHDPQSLAVVPEPPFPHHVRATVNVVQ